jgi:modulator of FtsH protease
MEAWHDFAVAQVGASAALAGLLFVAVSINLEKILASPVLPNRAIVPFALLLGTLIICSILLLPEQPISRVGILVLIGGSVVWLFVTTIDVRRMRETDRQYVRFEYPRIVMTQLAALPYIIAGVLLVTGGVGGEIWIVPAVIFSYIKAFADAWVLLIEINR